MVLRRAKVLVEAAVKVLQEHWVAVDLSDPVRVDDGERFSPVHVRGLAQKDAFSCATNMYELHPRTHARTTRTQARTQPATNQPTNPSIHPSVRPSVHHSTHARTCTQTRSQRSHQGNNYASVVEHSSSQHLLPSHVRATDTQSGNAHAHTDRQLHVHVHVFGSGGVAR